MTTTGAAEHLEALAQALAERLHNTANSQAPGAGPNNSRELLLVAHLAESENPLLADAGAELLWRLAVHRQLTDELAALAGALLDHRDPFVRALAEWAIATRVGLDNGGQHICWPREDPPGWFRRWLQLSPDELLEMDYARSAIGYHLHHDGRQLASSGEKILARAQAAAADLLPAVSAPAAAAVHEQLQQLEAICRHLSRHASQRPDDLFTARCLWLSARRAARPIVLANPAIDFRRILFVTLHPAHSHRNITGSQYPWVHKPGGDICIKTGLHPGDPVEPVLRERLGPGHVHGIDLWWDGDRVVFGFARQPNWPPPWDTVSGDNVFLLRGHEEPTHLFEVCLDGTGLQQLTNHPYWSDLEPTYCADGTVVFASDRSGRSSECGKFSADHTVINLYGLRPDGKTIYRLNDNKDIDRYPHSLDNGLVAYTRWEYQERHFFEVHAIWQVRPDGTKADAVFNQHLRAPYGLRDTRSIPGSRKLVSIATGHHTFAYGPVVLVDPAKGINNPAAIRSVTPNCLPEEGPPPGPPVAEGGVPDRGGLYQTPWALSEKCFLVSYSPALPASGTQGGDNAAGFAIYLIDVWGNKELVHRDLLLSCAWPMVLRPRPKPPVLQPSAGFAELSEQKSWAACYVANVRQGWTVPPGATPRYLRISQRVGWPLDEKIGAMRWIPGNAWQKQSGFWAWAPVRIIGEVPVAPDGSAAFLVPADQAVYFQLLDDKHMELRRMRSHVTFRPGEIRGCTGCHESRVTTSDSRGSMPIAVRQPPAMPSPPPWGADRLLGYEWLVQPVLDRHCTRCHNAERADGGLDLSPLRQSDGLLRSFHSLFPAGKASDASGGKLPGAKLPLVAISNRFDGAAVTEPQQFGSHRSRLIRVLLDDPLHRQQVQLSDDDWLALVAWIDANAPYYDTFFNRRPPNGGPPRRDVLVLFPLPEQPARLPFWSVGKEY